MDITVNQVIISGTIDQPPDLKYTNNNTPCLKMRVAIREPFTKQDGSAGETKTVLTVIVWRDWATKLYETLYQGSRVMVKGKLENRSFENEMGDTTWVTQINAFQVMPMGAPPQAPAQSSGYRPEGQYQPVQSTGQPQYQPSPSQNTGAEYGRKPPPPAQSHKPEDDLPF